MGAVALTLLSLALHASALNGWWLSDDPQVLVQAVRQSPREYFFVPDAWQYLSASNFTPLVTLSFETDLALAGLRPWFFYLHQILALTLAIVLLFLYLQPYAGSLAAFLGSAVFAVSPQAVLAARTLMVRHYVEGLVLSLIALLLWRRGRLRPSLVWSVLAATAYLLAVLAKEVYALVPLLMLLDSRLNGESWRSIFRRIIPTVLAGLVYLAWRVSILGSAGGYGLTIRFEDLEYLSVAAMSHAPAVTMWAVTAGLAALCVIALVQSPRRALLVLVTMTVVGVVPLLPVLSLRESRYGFVLFALIGAACALVPGTARRLRTIAVAAALVVFTATLIAGLIVLRSHSVAARDSVAEGRFIWSGRADQRVLVARSPGWYLGGLAELRGRENPGPMPRYILSEEGLWVEPIDLEQTLQVREGVVTALPASVADSVRQRRAGMDAAAPINVTVSREDHQIRWELGPETSESWVFLSYPEYDEYQIPPRGSRIIPEPQGLQQFRVMRGLPGGRWTITPPLTLPGPDQTVRFTR